MSILTDNQALEVAKSTIAYYMDIELDESLTVDETVTFHKNEILPYILNPEEVEDDEELVVYTIMWEDEYKFIHVITKASNGEELCVAVQEYDSDVATVYEIQ